MDAESFHALALRVILRDADEQERRALEAELTATPARREEFEQLRATLGVLNIVAPLTEAAQAGSPALPAHRVGELRTAVRQHFGPAATREKSGEKAEAGSPGFRFFLRWVFGGTGIAALGFAIAVGCFANRTVEIGRYTVETVRSGEQPISVADVPSAQFVQFNYDAQFDEWKSKPLSWTEHARIWVDNENDLVHVKRRVRFGQIITETFPLAPTNAGQREQVKQLVEEFQR